MTNRPRKTRALREAVSEECEKLGVPDPLDFLVHVMAGTDPRHAPSILYTLVKEGEAQEDEFGQPPVEIWQELKKLVLNNPIFEGEPVLLDHSYGAAKDLLSYLHPKLKAVQVSGELEHLVKVQPLTDEEIERFNKIVAEF